MAPYKIAIVPSPEEQVNLVVPFSSDSSFRLLVEVALKRGSQHRPMNLTPTTQILLRLGQDDGFLVDMDDTIQDVVTSGEVLFILLINNPVARPGSISDGQQRQRSTSRLDDMSGEFQIRVVTPSLARRHRDLQHLPLLDHGAFFSPATSLQEIKQDIATHLELEIHNQPHSTTNECNCKLAEQLLERGIWERMACNSRSCEHGCSYNLPGTNHSCAVCLQRIDTSFLSPLDDSQCSSDLLIRKDLPCQHVVHVDCVEEAESPWLCPDSCYRIEPEQLQGSCHVLVVSGNSKVGHIPVRDPVFGSIMDSLQERYGPDLELTTTVHSKGDVQLEDGRYARLPIVVLCAKARHSNNDSAIPSSDTPASTVLDLHSAEGPITTPCMGLTAEKTTLAQLAVKGVVTMYAVERTEVAALRAEKMMGKDGMFTAAECWELPNAQTERGTAAFLSCLRVFAHLISAECMDEIQQNEILKVVHKMTRFPPAVRAVHLLMDGKCLRPDECAAITQSFSPVLQDLIPGNLINKDFRRTLEGARLLFGLILHAAKCITVQGDESSSGTSKPPIPYLTSYKTVDLRNMKTLEPVVVPIQTSFGLVEEACYESLRNGFLGFACVDLVGEAAQDPDLQALRVAMHFGGLASEVTYYDADALNLALLQQSPQKTRVKHINTLSKDLIHLAKLCEQVELCVIHPRSLSSVKTPALTLDRDGLLAVYVGRAACAAPDRDIAIFRPMRGSEENIDVTIVAKLIEPIVQAREHDGTAVFDLFSTDVRLKSTTPNELVMVCVDCSGSMRQSSNFAGINDAQNDPHTTPTVDDVFIDDLDEAPVTLAEAKDWLSGHESLEDTVCLIHNTTRSRQASVARQIIAFLQKLTFRELAHYVEHEKTTRNWASRSHLTSRRPKGRIAALQKTLTVLNMYGEALCDLLVFKARDPAISPMNDSWYFGDDIPKVEKPTLELENVNIAEELTIPADVTCPITGKLYQDPVSTTDGFTFERRAIERWFQIRRSSPLTGLLLQDISLRRNQIRLDQVRRWVQGDDIVEASSPPLKRSRLSAASPGPQTLTIHFVSPTGTFSRPLPKTLSLADLHKVAFRGMQGVHSEFSVYLNGSILPATAESLVKASVRHGAEILVRLSVPHGAHESRYEEMCLIKVYRTDACELFSYWVPWNTTSSMASILFRSWRYQGTEWISSMDSKISTDFEDTGDGMLLATPSHPWHALASKLSTISPSEIVDREQLYSTHSSRPPSHMKPIPSHGFGDEGQAEELGYEGFLPHKVLKVGLRSYQGPEELKAQRLRRLRMLTRLDVSKQIFGSFINRIIAYNYPASVGLVTFGSTAVIDQDLTETVEKFRHSIEKINAAGDTALWDALALATDRLIHYSEKYPDAKKRIICLSDGRDTCSKRTMNDVCRLMATSGILLDSCSIGSEDNMVLRNLSYLTGGYKFVPKSLEEAVAICELKPVLSQHERPPIIRRVTPVLSTSGTLSVAWQLAAPDLVTRYNFPARKAHPRLGDHFVRIGAFKRDVRSTALSLHGSNPTSKPAVRSRRLLTEIRDLAAHPHPSYEVYVSESNMGFWKIVLEGPPESAYSAGTFVLYLDAGEGYPQAPPQARFITPIFHPNINRHGRICHSIFDRNWTIDTTSRQVLDTVFGLLLVPEFTDPINMVVTLNFYWDEVEFRAEVQKHIEKFATKGRQDWGREIAGES